MRLHLSYLSIEAMTVLTKFLLKSISNISASVVGLPRSSFSAATSSSSPSSYILMRFSNCVFRYFGVLVIPLLKVPRRFSTISVYEVILLDSLDERLEIFEITDVFHELLSGEWRRLATKTSICYLSCYLRNDDVVTNKKEMSYFAREILKGLKFFRQFTKAF